ncbi:MAG: biotin--[acetyl-CoA-carboxylase] ligase [Acidimicrobiia bacterium]|nr:biotin--[acetyl-CoA-carboxylase] ligase [Acidimicrobiia bacterium]MBT8194583.1 biotin--[acetyl-CoA-carboxylase] ligase [Acidimicrobiia bacterium]NNL69154.1 biotin--[acetyl-CoA-carboxylase] ligase [Acidimicrobiia bacterium]
MATEYVVHHLDRVASTQDEARERYVGVPCLVTAGEQAAGRGRSGTGWLNAPRALAASLAFEPDWPPARIPLLTLVAGLAARRVLGAALQLKWPNDVVTAAGDKVAGLLAERTGPVVVIGLGANLFWPDPPDGVAAMSATDPGPTASQTLAVDWAESLLAAVEAGPGDWGAGVYRSCSATIGTDITWDGGGPGKAVDIDEDGGLVVQAAAGLVTLRSGRVHSVRPTTLPTEQEDD